MSATVPAASLPDRDAVMKQAGHENFTVANVLLGARRRRHLLAIYGYCRLVDDVGDEVEGDRGALLDAVEQQLDAIYAGAQPSHPVMRELALTVRACALPEGPFRRLVAANRMDQTVTRYQTFEQLLGYCQLSAAPVGELVLGVFGAATPERIALSDRICAGLQIVEHLQDVAEDHARGRVYLPQEDLVRFGCDDATLSAYPNAPLRTLIAFEARRARSLLGGGAPLARTLSLRPRIAVAGFVAGGRAALDALDGGEIGSDPPGRSGPARARSRHRSFPGAFIRAVMGR